MRLGRARNGNRAEADGPLSAADAIFSRFQRQFNDPELTLSFPARADYLGSFHEMNPNDDARIAITRTYVWLKEQYFNTVKSYNIAMKKWQKGTGGGSGAPENFCDWGDRDGEMISNYASAGKGDYLAWIYMLDKDIGYAFNMINEPPPEMSVMEDGNNTSGKKKKSNSNPAEEFGKTFSESMDKVGLLLSTVIGANTGTAHGEQQIETYQAGPSEHMDDMNKALELIRKLESQAEAMRNRTGNGDLNERANKRIKIVEEALERAWEHLDDLGEKEGTDEAE